jgi:hypothetical protein
MSAGATDNVFVNTLSAPELMTQNSWLKILGSTCTPLIVGLSPLTAWKYVGKKLLAVIMQHKLHMPYTQLVQTMRCLIRLPGSIARSPMCRSQTMKMIAMTIPPTRRPMIVALSQANAFPEPNCRARRIMMAAGTKRAKPKRSSCGMTLRTSAREKVSFFGSSGT